MINTDENYSLELIMVYQILKKILKYAKLLVANGINVQPGHTVALSIDVEQAELAHLLVSSFHALEQPVIVQWSDDIINRERFLHADMDRIEEVPAYKKLRWNICWPKGKSLRCSFIRSRCP